MGRSHLKGKFAAKMTEMGVKQIFAPVIHPSSVGLAERYVQMLLAQLRSVIQHSTEYIFDWDESLPIIFHAVNPHTWVSQAELLLGFNPTFLPEMEKFDETLRATQVSSLVEAWI